MSNIVGILLAAGSSRRFGSDKRWHRLAAGVAAAQEAKGWLVALADMPSIAAASYRAVLDALVAGAGIARPMLDGQVGHPVGFAAAYRDGLLSLTGDRGGKAIIAAHPAAVADCPVSDPGILFDIDTPAAA